MENGIVYYLNPILLEIPLPFEDFGPIQLRYYGIIFAAMLYIGFLLWRKQMLRGGYSSELADRYLIWGVIAVLAGSRLGHCLFYEPSKYLSNPIEILYFWKGGLASHGATIGLVVAMLGFSIKYKLRFLEVLDRFSMSAAVGAAAVRLGNFFNSEIVGRVTDVPWAVKFLRHDCYRLKLHNACDILNMENPESHSKWSYIVQNVPARHPSQLYEFALGLFVLLSLYLADRFAGREKRPLGLLAGLFLTIYFLGRFFVEFVKEYQTDLQREEFLTMGQYLSIIPFAIGLALVIWSLVRHKATDEGRDELIARAAFSGGPTGDRHEEPKIKKRTKKK